jgi:rRNA maturation endonuclease Nob1
MQLITYRCTKCGAIQTLPDTIEEEEPCIFCGSAVERKE